MSKTKTTFAEGLARFGAPPPIGIPRFCPFDGQTIGLTAEHTYACEGGAWDENTETSEYEIEMQGYRCAQGHFFAVERVP